MWKTVYECVIGTSHRGSGIPCQDACQVARVCGDEENLLVACLADGAGSASHSGDGAEIACETFVRIVERNGRNNGICAVDHVTILEWCGEIRARIEERARVLEVEPRQLASTFLGAVIGESAALFIQIGDGAIVMWNGTEYQPVFWPQSGEFANMTNFLTDEHFQDALEWRRLEERVDEIAVFSDGLERLVLRFAERTVHGPFLEPLFAALRHTENPDAYFEPLRAFLDSPKVNERTDDDKTLILATRLMQCSHHDALC